MERRFLAGWCVAIAVTWLLPAGAAGQTQTASEGWTLTRTAWGDPNLEGTWSFATITPLERPERYAGRDRLTAEEVTALNADALTRGDQPPPPGDPGAYNAFWFDRGESTGRTALIVDPLDGRIPFTAAGSARRDARRALLQRPAHGPEDRTPGERCVHHTKDSERYRSSNFIEGRACSSSRREIHRERARGRPSATWSPSRR